MLSLFLVLVCFFHPFVDVVVGVVDVVDVEEGFTLCPV